MKYNLIISDLDGCLASESGGPFDLQKLSCLADHNQLAEANQDRPPITICTGRPQPFAEAMCRVIGNQKIPCIAENGVWLYHPETNRYEQDPAIDQTHSQAVIDAARILREKYAGRGVTQQPAKTASVTLYHPENQFLRSIADEVRELLDSHGWPFRVSMTWDYINCDLTHISKASGLRRFFEQTGFDPKQAIGIGDTLSDLPIAEQCGWFGCPSNACDTLKSHADYVSDQEELDGVLDILRELSILN